MIGQYVMTQRDVQEDRRKADSIGMGSFMIDTHHSQRILRPDGTLENEGDVQVPVQPYEIPYGVLIPQRGECDNFLVPVCVSASHVAYGSLRMEPQYMIMGQAAGVAAAQAIRADVAVHAVDVARLQDRLREQGQVLSLASADAPNVNVKSLEGVVVDNAAAEMVGSWRTSVAVGPFVGLDYACDQGLGDAGTARFVPALPKDGPYEVRIAYNVSPNRATNVTVVVNAADGLKTHVVNQKVAAPAPPFASLKTYPFRAGREGWVEIRTAGADGYVVADAVQWIFRGNP